MEYHHGARRRVLNRCQLVGLHLHQPERLEDHNLRVRRGRSTDVRCSDRMPGSVQEALTPVQPAECRHSALQSEQSFLVGVKMGQLNGPPSYGSLSAASFRRDGNWGRFGGMHRYWKHRKLWNRNLWHLGNGFRVRCWIRSSLGWRYHHGLGADVPPLGAIFDGVSRTGRRTSVGG